MLSLNHIEITPRHEHGTGSPISGCAGRPYSAHFGRDAAFTRVRPLMLNGWRRIFGEEVASGISVSAGRGPGWTRVKWATTMFVKEQVKSSPCGWLGAREMLVAA